MRTMKSIMKSLALLLVSTSIPAFATAQLQSGNTKPKGPLTAVDFTVPATTSIINHSSGWVDLTAADVDEYWIYDVNQWKPIPGNNTSGTVSLTSSTYGGSGLLVQALSVSGNSAMKTYRYGITADISGLNASISFVLTFTYDDGDPESLLYDNPVSKSLTVTVTPNEI